MKAILLFCICTAVMIASCKKDDTKPSGRPGLSISPLSGDHGTIRYHLLNHRKRGKLQVPCKDTIIASPEFKAG